MLRDTIYVAYDEEIRQLLNKRRSKETQHDLTVNLGDFVLLHYAEHVYPDMMTAMGGEGHTMKSMERRTGNSRWPKVGLDTLECLEGYQK